MKTILITGGAGFVGANLAARLIKEGHRVRALDRIDPAVHPRHTPIMPDLLEGAEFQGADVRDPAAVSSALDGVRIVFHFAAKTAVEESMEVPEEYLSHNTVGTATLARLARGHVDRLVLASSRAVYGEGRGQCLECGEVTLEPRRRAALIRRLWDPTCPRCGGPVSVAPCSEDAPLRPVSMYGLSKWSQEEIAELFLKDSGTELVVLRYFNVYGARQSFINDQVGIANTFVLQALQGRPFVLYEDGRQIRDFVHIDDVTEANIGALNCPPGTYNIGSGKPTTLRELACAIAGAVGVPARFEETGLWRWGDVRHSLADIGLAQAVLGWRPSVTLAQGVDRLARWMASANASR